MINNDARLRDPKHKTARHWPAGAEPASQSQGLKRQKKAKNVKSLDEHEIYENFENI